MLVLNGPVLTTSIADPAIRSLAEQRWSEILDGEAYDYDTHGYMIVVEPSDSVEAIEKASSCPILHDLFNESRFGDPDFAPAFEWLAEHSTCYEMVFIYSDDGFGVNVLIPKAEGVDTALLALCARYAEPETAAT